MREAYRLNKAPLYEIWEKEEKQLAVMMIYTSKEILDYSNH